MVRSALSSCTSSSVESLTQQQAVSQSSTNLTTDEFRRPTSMITRRSQHIPVAIRKTRESSDDDGLISHEDLTAIGDDILPLDDEDMFATNAMTASSPSPRRLTTIASDKRTQQPVRMANVPHKSISTSHLPTVNNSGRLQPPSQTTITLHQQQQLLRQNSHNVLAANRPTANGHSRIGISVVRIVLMFRYF
jgi:hypothetical protein